MALNISIEQRFLTLLGQLKHMPPCSSRQEAHDMLLLLWMRICEGAGARRQLLNSMRQRTLCAEHGWKNLDKSPCYWDSETTPGIRIYLHANGTIVIQRQSAGFRNPALQQPPGVCRGVDKGLAPYPEQWRNIEKPRCKHRRCPTCDIDPVSIKCVIV